MKFLTRWRVRLHGAVDGAFHDLSGERRRCDAKCYYTADTVWWAAVLAFATRRGSLLGNDMMRDSAAMPSTLWALSGQPEAGTEGACVPCADTVRYWLSAVRPELLDKVLLSCAEWMARSKLFDGGRLRGRFVIAVDGSKQESRRASRPDGADGNRMVLRASVIMRGFALPLMTEPLGAYAGEAGKRDCELAALRRLAKRLKEAFPRLPICLSGDALYACAPVFAMCAGYGWCYIATFREGRGSARYAEAEALMAANSENGGKWPREAGARRARKGRLRWAEDVEMGGFCVNVVHCTETRPGHYDGMFATDLPVGDVRSAAEVAIRGRMRWNIESSFHVQKNGGYGMEHNFCDDDACSRNLHTAMQVAYFLCEVFLKCLARPKVANCGKLPHVRIIDMIVAVMRTRPVADPGPGWENLHSYAPG